MSPTWDDEYMTFIPVLPEAPDLSLYVGVDKGHRRGIRYRYNSIERNMRNALKIISNIIEALDLPRSIKRTAAVIYRTALEKKLAKGRSINAMVGASIYAACRIHRIPRTLDEIAKAAGVSRKELGRCYRLLLRNIEGLNVPPAMPEDYIVRFAALLDMSTEAVAVAKDIIRRAKELGITTGKDPTGLAAAALYIAGLITGEKRTQRAIAEVATVTEVTVRNRYKELVKKLGIDLNTRFFIIMRLALSVSLSIALIPTILAALKAFEIYGSLDYVLRISSLAAVEFIVLAHRAYDMLNTQEADLIFFIYQRTYERSIRFVPVISFLTITVVALYALAPIVVFILLLPITRYSSRITYTTNVPFFGDLRKAILESIKGLVAIVILVLAVPLFSIYGPNISLYALRERFYPIYVKTLELAKSSPKVLHDAFITYSPIATLIAALIAIGARASAKVGFSLGAAIGLFLSIIAFLLLKFYYNTLIITAFVFVTAIYERNSMNVSKSLIVPNVGSLSRIVPLGFTIVMTFIGGTLEKYLGRTIIPPTFISLLTFLSLALGLILIRLLLRLPTLSGMKLGVIRL